MSCSSSSVIDVPLTSIPAPHVTWLRRLWDGPRTVAGRRAAFAAITAAASAAATFLYFNDPSATGRRHWFPPCPFHTLTGCHCPGCGSTRALYHLLHGHLAAACRMNVLMVLCLPYLAYAYFAYAARVCFPQSRWANLRAAPAKPLWVWLLLIVLLFYWVLRNVPAYPFTLLAPH